MRFNKLKGINTLTTTIPSLVSHVCHLCELCYVHQKEKVDCAAKHLSTCSSIQTDIEYVRAYQLVVSILPVQYLKCVGWGN